MYLHNDYAKFMQNFSKIGALCKTWPEDTENARSCLMETIRQGLRIAALLKDMQVLMIFVVFFIFYCQF
jgi:hypothetical protein